jgi:hypothetical protein
MVAKMTSLYYNRLLFMTKMTRRYSKSVQKFCEYCGGSRIQHPQPPRGHPDGVHADGAAPNLIHQAWACCTCIQHLEGEGWRGIKAWLWRTQDSLEDAFRELPRGHHRMSSKFIYQKLYSLRCTFELI